MNRYALILLALMAVGGACIWLVATRPVSPASVPPPIAAPARLDKPASSLTFPVPAIPKIAEVAEKTPPSPPAPHPWPADAAAARRRIELLEASADPRFATELASYLAHPDPALRRRALQALLLGGDETAVPSVRAAEVRAIQSGELDWAGALSEAAEFLAQPWEPGTRPPPKTIAEIEKEWQHEGSPEERKHAKPVGSDPAETLVK